MTQKRSDKIFDELSYARHRSTLPEYEVVPEHKSYIDAVNRVSAEEVSRGNRFLSRSRVYEYEVSAPAEKTEQDELDMLKFKPEVMPSEETMKLRLSQNLSAEACESMLTGKRKAQKGEVVIVDEIEEEEQSDKQAHITLNSRGKIAVAAYIAIILSMLIIALVTASNIATLSVEEQVLREELNAIYYGDETSEGIYELQRRAEELSTPSVYEVNGKLAEQGAGFTMYIPTQTVSTISVAQLTPEVEYSQPSNWFDAICKFIAELFGR